MKDRLLRYELEHLGVIKLNTNDTINEGEFMRLRYMEKKIDLIMDYLGLELETNMRLKKISNPKNSN